MTTCLPSCCKLALGNDRFVEVFSTKDNEKRVNLHEWKNDRYATKKEISLNLNFFKTFALALDLIDTALSKKEELNYHMDSNVFCTIHQGNPCVNIRQYWRPPDKEMLVPTKRGLCFRPMEYRALKYHIAEIEKVIHELESLVSCFLCDDHMDQQGMLQCPTCNPFKYVN